MSIDRRDLRDSCVLLVDDDPATLVMLQRFLEHEGFKEVIATGDPTEVEQLCETHAPDMILLDLKMEPIDGFQVLETLHPRLSEEDFLPVIVLTADPTPGAKRKALSMGARDFLTKPYDLSEVLLRIENLIETRFLHRELREQNHSLEALVRQRTTELWSAVTQLERSERDVRLSREETIQRLAGAAEFRDDDTGTHLQRMSRYCEIIAERLDLAPDAIELIRLASQLHDIGKIGIPDNVLLNPGSFTPRERKIMETHAEKGYRMLGGSRSELLNLASLIAYTHHERVDGSGYPRGLTGDEIPLEGRIAAIADVFDALTSDRVYRKAFQFDDALAMMKEGRGSHFDPELLDIFVASLDDVALTKARYTD